MAQPMRGIRWPARACQIRTKSGLLPPSGAKGKAPCRTASGRQASRRDWTRCRGGGEWSPSLAETVLLKGARGRAHPAGPDGEEGSRKREGSREMLPMFRQRMTAIHGANQCRPSPGRAMGRSMASDRSRRPASPKPDQGIGEASRILVQECSRRCQKRNVHQNTNANVHCFCLVQTFLGSRKIGLGKLANYW